MDNKVCRKCLRKGSHLYKNCKKQCEVDGCVANRRHHTLLHKLRSDLSASTTQPEEQAAIVAHNAVPIVSKRQPLLKIIPVTLSGKKGSVDTFALLDDGSSATLLDRSVANALEDEGPREPLRIHCIGGLTKLSDVSFVNIKVRGRYSSDTFEIRARSIPNLNLSAQTASFDDVQRFSHLTDLADVLAYGDAQPTCLIGTDNWHLLLTQSVRRGTKSEPAAALTPLGWVLFGFMGNTASSVEFVNHVNQVEDDQLDNNLEHLVKNYYKLDSIGIEKKLHSSPSDRRAIEILDETTVRLTSGRFQTGLLWRDNIKIIPNSKRLALSRFQSLESKMAKDKTYATSYKQNIQGMIDKGYAELCSGPPTGNITWYLPHFGVVHPHKKKLRVVHDAAAKCNGVSLNSMLLSGPDLLQPLLAIVMRFREGKIAITGDIKEMFPQVKIRPEDRDAQRFLWRDDPQSPLLEYRMSSMIFGATSSPCTALYLKNKNALEFQNSYPKAAQSIIENHYMDDYLESFESVEEAARLASEIVTVHKAAGFEMRSWVSNHAEALTLLPLDLRATEASEVGLGPSSPSRIRVLGLTWLVGDDSLSFLKSIPKFPPTLTKRSALSLLMSIYDPLGLITPLIIKGRILFQMTWKLGLDWDQKLSEGLFLKYQSWFRELENLSGSAIPRCYSEGKQVIESQLHVLCDASELAYACVAYWRFVLSDGSVKLALIGGKARLAPLKPATIPRMELQAALIAEISDLTDVQSWRYVPSGLNVADDATRDTAEFSLHSRWFTGPTYLLSPEATWPREPLYTDSSTTSEIKMVECLVVPSAESPALSPVVADHRRFSRWIRLLRATARAHQSAKMFRTLLPLNSKLFLNSPRCDRKLPLLSADDLNSAEHHLLMSVQRDSLSEELDCVNAGRPVSRLSKLKNVSLLVCNGLLRLSGRTSASDAIESRPIVLDGKHQITRLLIHEYHIRCAHANNELVVNEMRQKFYIIGLRSAVKQVASRCQRCRVWKARPVPPPIGDLPDVRMAIYERPFSYVGLDYFGPLNVTIGRKHAKRWVALFTCMTVRAVHLEIVDNLSADSAIMALRRFISRRGCPSCIYSDNGTAFVGASKMLAEVYEFATTKRIQWKFIPPSAPFMGGCWERLVRNVKSALSATLKEQSPREETLHTLLLEAEAIVNSRPLTHVSTEPDAEEALTPFTFLIGTPSYDLQTRPFNDTDLSSRAQWRKAQRLADHFWQRFTKEYLPSLVPRRSSPTASTSFIIGDLVVIVDGTLPRRCWPRGRIVATYPGKDRIVRVVDVQTKGGVLRRPVKKLAKLVVSP
ncbi:uncharacterized protein LOC135079544 [Ostrinia nubilalis]|uniref:uncharacterized protein LOC135079544 n=1 Tax=Ostrinia nubilalis TaxID=29057 RepID=UPI003082288B